MKIYKCEKVGENVKFTELMLNQLASEGWEVKATFCNGYYLILEKEST